MNERPRIRGVLAPVVTPFLADLSPDPERLARHCRWLLSQGVGLAVFGTNSEANSLSLEEKKRLLSSLVEAGIDPARMMPGTGACALTDAVELTAHAVKLGCAGALMLPPFYYKGVVDEGLYRYFAEIIDRVGDDRLRVYLYHIPQVSHVGLGLDLVDRLLGAYPGIIAGIKDSAGDWDNTRALLEAFAARGFDVFAGSESFLLKNLRAGGAGCITATGNVNPGAIHRLSQRYREGDADRMQEDLDAIRAVFQRQPMIAALKQAIARYSGDPAWVKVRPPLVELTSSQASTLIEELERRGFSMPGVAFTSP